MSGNKGSCAKRGNQKPHSKTPRNDHGGKAYKDSEWDLKANERSVAKKFAFIKGICKLCGSGNRRKKMQEDGQ